MAGSGSLGDLIVRIAGDIAQLEASMSRAERITANTAQAIEVAMARAESAIKGLDAAWLSFESVKAFGGNVEGAIELAAELEHVARQTGTTANALSGLRATARASNTDFGSVATSLARMQKNMIDAAAGGGKAHAAFDAMKLSVRDSNGALKEGDQFMLEVAKKLAGLDNETQKVAYAMQIFGRAGYQILPFLDDLAAKGEIAGKTTDAQARAAESYMRSVRALNLAQAETWKIISQQLIPVMQTVVQLFIDVRTGAGGLNDTLKDLSANNTIRTWANDAVLGVLKLIDGFTWVWRGVQAIGEIVALVAVYFTESFRHLGTVVGVVAGIVGDLGRALLGVIQIQSGQLTAGWNNIKGAAASLTAGIGQLKDQFSESFSSIGAATDNLRDRLAALTDPNMTERYFDSMGKLLVQQDAIIKKGKDHADVVGKVLTDAYDALVTRLDKTIAKLQAEVTYMQAFGRETHATHLAEVNAQLADMTPLLTEHAKRLGISVDTLKEFVQALAAKADALEGDKQHEQDVIRVHKELNDALWANHTAAVAQEKDLLDQLATFGQLPAEVTRYKIALLEVQKAMATDEGIIIALNAQIEKLRDVAKLQDQFTNLQNFVGAMKEAANSIGQIAVAFTEGWAHGIDTARAKFKSFIQEVISILAQKFFLQIVASIVGGSVGSALLGTAGQIGANTLGGSVASWAGNAISGTSIGGTLIGGTGDLAAGFAGGYGGTATTAAMLESGASWTATFGTAVGEVLAAIPVWGWIAAGIIALAGLADHFRDRENWRAMLGFGPNANAYTSQGPFGAQGFQYIEGNDAFNRQLQTFMASTTGIDRVIAGTLDQATIAHITEQLAGPYGNRANGQPGEMSFPPGDSTVAQQITLEFLQHKYGIIFDAIDSKFASWIRSFTGTSEDLLKAIGEEAVVLAALPRTGLHIDVAGLRAMSQDGETLAQTFARVMKGWDDLVNAFTPSEIKFGAIQDDLHNLFDSLQQFGYQVPTTRAGWLDVMRSLDLTTESGRELFARMTALAPAFDAVTSAVQEAINSFYSIAGQLSPAFNRSHLHDVFMGKLEAWRNLGGYTVVDAGGKVGQQMTPYGPMARTPDETIGDIQNMIRDPAAMQAALTYAQGLGGNAVDVLTGMLTAFGAWNSAVDDSTTTTTTAFTGATNSVNTFADSVDQATKTLWSAKDNVADWMSKTLLNKQLSPLDPAGQLQFAHDQYVDNLMKAQGGDVDAISHYTDFAQAYLDEARSFFASGTDYQNIVRGVLNQAKGIAGLDEARPVTAGDAKANTAAIIAALDKLNTGIKDGNALSQASMNTLTDAIRTGKLTF